ncbi:MAG: hypothetical protein EAX96_20840 [Candidatus Lokiarchaeota archaeon]|nr:hypothetical protein [Candidatus Lokiarchaeota archaeon]
MKCDKCEKEVGPLFCGNCRMEMKGLQKPAEGLIPLLLWDAKREEYVIGCTCIKCPWNDGKGYCSTRHKILPIHLFHEFDGDNIIHQVCG